jgi:ureidoglycolate lyase
MKMSVQEVKILPLEEVDDKDFKPYGQIMGPETGEPYETLEILQYWTKNADLGPENEKIDGGLLVCNKSGRKIKFLERHPQTAENFIVIEGECIFVMAPTDNMKEKPDLSRLKAFYMNGKLGVSLHKGTWHWPPIPLGEFVKFVLIRKGELWETTEIRELEELAVTELKIIL